MRDFGSAWPKPEEESAWRRSSLVAEIVFFFLTTIAVVAAAELLPGWFVMIGCLALAEFLIRAHHFWRTGVESALWIGGLYAFIFSLPHSGRPEALLILAAGAAVAGWRVRNALFGTLAAVLVVAYFEERHWPALMFSLAVAVIALFAITRRWRRASTELLFQMLLIVMPIAGYVAIYQNTTETWMLFFPLAVIFAVVGIRRRLRVPFVASAIACTIAIVDLHLPLSLETQLMTGGAIALATAAIVARALRNRTSGFVLDLKQQSDLEAVMSSLPLATQAHSAPQPVGGGGEFGGAGAGGNY